MPTTIAASLSDIDGGALYTKIVKSLLIILITLLKRYYSFFITVNTCLNSMIDLAI